MARKLVYSAPTGREAASTVGRHTGDARLGGSAWRQQRDPGAGMQVQQPQRFNRQGQRHADGTVHLDGDQNAVERGGRMRDPMRG